MNTGIIASRYATALLKLVDETGNGELVARQVRTILGAMENAPGLSRAISDKGSVSSAQKVALLTAALGDEPMADELSKFINLMVAKGRDSEAVLVFHAFVSAYNRSRGVMSGKLVVPAESSDTSGLEEKLKALVESSTGCKLELQTQVDPSIIGGFVFETEDRLLDASVSHQLDLIRRQFVERNRRII